MKLKGLIIGMLMAVSMLGACGADNNLQAEYIKENKEYQVSDEINELISDYIVQKYSQINSDTDTGEQFEVHKIYGVSETMNTINVYMYSSYGSLNKITGKANPTHSLPVVVRLKHKDAGYVVTSYTEPKEGSQSRSSLEKMFPKKYLKIYDQDNHEIRKEVLQKKMDDLVTS